MVEIETPVLRNDDETLKDRLSDNAYNNILPARYLKKDEEGEIIEEQEEIFARVADNVAVAEAGRHKTDMARTRTRRSRLAKAEATPAQATDSSERRLEPTRPA